MTLRYMLDTDSVSYALRGEGHVGKAILNHRPSELCVSAISVGELRYGAHRRASQRLHRIIDAFTTNLDVVGFDAEAADVYGRLASTLAGRGSPIGQLDALIAAHAMSLGLTLVSNNRKHFARVRGLKVESWV